MFVVDLLNERNTLRVELSSPQTYALCYLPNGRIYAARFFSTPQKTYFINLPAGKYILKNAIRVDLRQLFVYDLQTIDLPLTERVGLQKKVEFRYNSELVGTPARINRFTGIIEFSRAFCRLPQEAKRFILLHEIGHLFYATEWKCDLFALYHFLKKGGNKSSALHALDKVLKQSEQSKARINNILKELKNVKVL